MKIFHPLLSLAAHYFIVYLVLFVPWDQEVVSASAAGQRAMPISCSKALFILRITVTLWRALWTPFPGFS